MALTSHEPEGFYSIELDRGDVMSVSKADIMSRYSFFKPGNGVPMIR